MSTSLLKEIQKLVVENKHFPNTKTDNRGAPIYASSKATQTFYKRS